MAFFLFIFEKKYFEKSVNTICNTILLNSKFL